jgi:ribosomal protein S18 acetylase RimI-like enzyme
VVVLQRDLATIRPPFTRSQRQLRRELTIREEPSPRPATWWSAATTGGFESSRFIAESRDGTALAEVWFWDIEPLSTGWSVPTAGMFDLFVSAERRRTGIATYLLSEAFAKLAARGVARVEAQTMRQNLPAITLYERLGFQQVDEGLVFRKDAP